MRERELCVWRMRAPVLQLGLPPDHAMYNGVCFITQPQVVMHPQSKKSIVSAAPVDRWRVTVTAEVILPRIPLFCAWRTASCLLCFDLNLSLSLSLSGKCSFLEKQNKCFDRPSLFSVRLGEKKEFTGGVKLNTGFTGSFTCSCFCILF